MTTAAATTTSTIPIVEVPQRPSRRDAQPLCGHPLWGEVGGLPCLRAAGHAPGHVYHDPTGSAVDDRHRDGGHG